MKEQQMSRLIVWAASIAFLAGTAIALGAEPPASSKKNTASKPDKAAIERSRKVVRILDDVYKQTIVLITDKYVHDEEDFAAGSAAVLLFKNISEIGDQRVRLLDATGEPYEPENVAKDAFEKEGIERIKAGEKFYDEVVKRDGKYELRAMTPVPVVMQKCIMCHAHYEDAMKQGKPIGAISYTVSIE
jgi:hypothetical protein